MALDKNDIEILQQLIHAEVTSAIAESEGRMTSNMESTSKESETRMMTYIESHIEKKIDILADGLLATNDRIDRLTDRIDEMNETVLANTLYIVKDAREKKAQ